MRQLDSAGRPACRTRSTIRSSASTAARVDLAESEDFDPATVLAKSFRVALTCSIREDETDFAPQQKAAKRSKANAGPTVQGCHGRGGFFDGQGRCF